MDNKPFLIRLKQPKKYPYTHYLYIYDISKVILDFQKIFDNSECLRCFLYFENCEIILFLHTHTWYIIMLLRMFSRITSETNLQFLSKMVSIFLKYITALSVQDNLTNSLYIQIKCILVSAYREASFQCSFSNIFVKRDIYILTTWNFWDMESINNFHSVVN